MYSLMENTTLGVIKGSCDTCLKHSTTLDSFINSSEIGNEIYYHMYKDINTMK